MKEELEAYIDLVQTQALALEKQAKVIDILSKKIAELTAINH